MARHTDSLTVEREYWTCDVCGAKMVDRPWLCRGCGKHLCGSCCTLTYDDVFTGESAGDGDQPDAFCGHCGGTLLMEFAAEAERVREQYQRDLHEIEKRWREKCRVRRFVETLDEIGRPVEDEKHRSKDR